MCVRACVQGNEFKVVPAGDWYHFRAKRPFVPMGAEEAEEHVRGDASTLL
jgi:hypothetical protein